MYEIKCGELWGGVTNIDTDVRTSAIDASLYSTSCHGKKGGDIYYISVCNGDWLTRIAIADVVGHGEEVSQTSELMYQKLIENMNDPDGNQILSDLNQVAFEHGFKALTTATIMGVYLKTNELLFAYAGHHPMLIRKHGDDLWQTVKLNNSTNQANLPLGFDNQTHFDQSAIAVASGDQMFLYTDGLVEAKNNKGESFGENRLHDLLKKHGNNFAMLKKMIVNALENFRSSSNTSDDITFLMVGIR